MPGEATASQQVVQNEGQLSHRDEMKLKVYTSENRTESKVIEAHLKLKMFNFVGSYVYT